MTSATKQRLDFHVKTVHNGSAMSISLASWFTNDIASLKGSSRRWKKPSHLTRKVSGIQNRKFW